MQGYLCLVLHAHLPFVRHPEHETFLEENWLFEAITESYLPLLRIFRGWQRDGIRARVSLTLSPTLCAMLQDPLLRSRYDRHLDQLALLAEKETQRTILQPQIHPLAVFYNEQLAAARQLWQEMGRDLVAAFGALQDAGILEIITTAATHAILPLLQSHPECIRGQILTAAADFRRCFKRDARGLWLPECAYFPGLENHLAEAGLRWFIVETHGLLQAQPAPRYKFFAPVFTPAGVAAFGRDPDSARQVWSRDHGYPGDWRYRDFYRDIGFDLEWDYLRPHLPGPQRSFTGIKYHRITGPGDSKEPYEPKLARQAVEAHAAHFVAERSKRIERLNKIMDRPPVIVAPYDAELFGHWWYEGPEFLDMVARHAQEAGLQLITPGDYLKMHSTNQEATPAASSWGEQGYWWVWLNEKNDWVYPHLKAAQDRMRELVQDLDAESQGEAQQTLEPNGPRAVPVRSSKAASTTGARSRSSERLAGAAGPDGPRSRALRQAARELMLAQASDWTFIMRTGTSPEYARKRVTEHLSRFNRLYEQLKTNTLEPEWLAEIEKIDCLFPEVEPRWWKH
jgi:1,4-alpha-glucan branching enzyme